MYYVYKDFPILQSHPQAGLAAEAAECAGEQGKYWEMHGALFAEPSAWDTTEESARETFRGYAETIGLETAPFEACFEEGRYGANVQANMAEGRYLGVTGTPAFVINGKLLAGAQPTEVFQQVIERELTASR